MRLMGIVNPSCEMPSFSIPVFHDPSGTYVQRIDEYDSIIGFDEIVLPNQITPVQLKGDEERSVGHTALWAFDFGDGEILIADRATVGKILQGRVTDYADRPFLLIEVARFLDDPSLIQRALSLATTQLQSVSPIAASNWLVSFASQIIAAEISKRIRLQNCLQKINEELRKVSDRKLATENVLKGTSSAEPSIQSTKILHDEQGAANILGISNNMLRFQMIVRNHRSRHYRHLKSPVKPDHPHNHRWRPGWSCSLLTPSYLFRPEQFIGFLYFRLA